jgi:hypothetical protein
MHLVSVEPSTGTLQRYDVTPPALIDFDKAGKLRTPHKRHLTHTATSGQPETFSAQVVEDFRTLPDAEFAVGFEGPAAMVFA